MSSSGAQLPPSRSGHGEGSNKPFVGNYEQYQGSSHRHQGLPPPAAHVRDPRLGLIDELRPNFFRDARVLDVGCNTGAVAVQLASSFGAASVTGIDVDRNLIRRAQDHLSFQRSRAKLNRLDEHARSQRSAVDHSYFPISSVLDHGHQPPPTGVGVDRAVGWLLNDVEFRTEDWAADAQSSLRCEEPYDVILALSVVKWVHLTHLDAGVRRFFGRCANALRHGGSLVLELQPWASYEKAVKPKKSPHLAENFKQIQLRPEHFGSVLSGLGFVEVAVSDELARPIYIYQKLR